MRGIRRSNIILQLAHWADDATSRRLCPVPRCRTCDRRAHRQPSQRSVTSSPRVKRLPRLGRQKNGDAPNLPLPIQAVTHQLAATAVGRQKNPTLKSGLWLGRGRWNGRAIAVNLAAVLAVFSAWRRAVTREKVMKALMVITSHDQLGNTGRKTGFWLEGLAAPYYVFKDAGVEITLASPKGGRPPLDPRSDEPGSRTELTIRFEKDAAAEAQLDKTVRLDKRQARRLRHRLLPGRPWPDVGSRRRRAFHQTDRVLHCCRQADRNRVPFHRGAASGQDDGRQVSWFKARKLPASPTARRKRWVSLSRALPCRR